MFRKKDDLDDVKVMPKLRIAKLDASRSGRSLCYIDQAILDDLKLTTGDIIEIIGKKRTAGIVVSNFADKGKNVIRIDGIQRLNLGSTIGDLVTIRPTRVSPAREIELASTKEIYDIKKQADIIKAKLIDKPIVAGDIVDIPGAFINPGVEKDPMKGIMRQMFNMQGDPKKTTLGPLRLIVIKTNPNNEIVRFTRDTRLKISKKIVYLDRSSKPLRFDDVVGLDNEIAEIRKILELSLTHPSFTEKRTVEPAKGILLVGPSGVGKTLLAKVIANETDYNFISIQPTDIYNKFQGDSEKKLKEVFEKAERNAPCLIFIDQIESLAPRIQKEMIDNSFYLEQRMVSVLMDLMDGMHQYRDIIILAATHKSYLIEPALLRPGRFDVIINLPLPDLSIRTKLYQFYTNELLLDEDISLEELAKLSTNFTGAHIQGVCRLAIIKAFKRGELELQSGFNYSDEVVVNTRLNKQDFQSAIEEITNRLT